MELAKDLVASGRVRLRLRLRLRVRVMDLVGERRAERTGLDDSPERMRDHLSAMAHVQVASDRGDRMRYRQLLAGARFGIAPFRPGCPGP